MCGIGGVVRHGHPHGGILADGPQHGEARLAARPAMVVQQCLVEGRL